MVDPMIAAPQRAAGRTRSAAADSGRSVSPFYVAPEQQMKDRADYARKGIARGRSVVVLHYADGILFVAENRSQALHKVSEIYDRIGFAAVGRYNEFENLRTAGIRYADLRGYSYDRTDVTGRGLANAYAQLLGTIFSSGGEKPYEVEIVVAELGATAEQDQIYRLTYDGSVADENNFAVMGGSADVITEVVGRGYRRRAQPGRRGPSWPSTPWPRTAGPTRPRASSASRPSRSPSSTGPGRCRASSAGSPVTPGALLAGRDRSAEPSHRRPPPVRGRPLDDLASAPEVAEPAGAETAGVSVSGPPRDRGHRRRADRRVDRLRPDRAPASGSTCATASRATPGSRPAWAPARSSPPTPAEVGLVVVAVPPPGHRRRRRAEPARATRTRRSPTSGRSRPGCSTPCGRARSTWRATSGRTRWPDPSTPAR